MFQRLIVLWGMPRSGTSWISQILASCPDVRYRQSPMFSWEFKNVLDEGSSRAEWEEVLRGAYASDNDFMSQSFRREAGQYPRFESQCSDPSVLLVKFDRFHNLTERMIQLFPEAMHVAVVRHPCGAIHSWLTAGHKEFPPDADPLEHWRSGAVKKSGYGDFFGFDDWKQVTGLHLRLAAARPDHFRIVRYERVVEAKLERSRELFDFLGLTWTEQTEGFLDASHRRHDDSKYAVFKNPAVKDRWRSELHPTIVEAIEADLDGTELAVFLD